MIVPAAEQMDRMGANFFRTVDMIVSNLAANPLVLTLPIGGEDNFQVRTISWTVLIIDIISCSNIMQLMH